MNTGMELMGMKECSDCGDPYTVTMEDTGICAGCARSRDFAALKAQLEAVTRERDEARAFAADREGLALQLDAAKEAIQYGIELRQKAERERDSWRSQRDEVHAEMEEQTRQKHAERQAKLDAMRERDEALESGARMRAVLERVRDAMRATGQEPDGDDDPRRPLATAVWAALSAPAPEPSERMMRVAEAAVRACREKIIGTAALPEHGRGIRHCLALLHVDRSALRAIVAKVTP